MRMLLLPGVCEYCVASFSACSAADYSFVIVSSLVINVNCTLEPRDYLYEEKTTFCGFRFSKVYHWCSFPFLVTSQVGLHYWASASVLWGVRMLRRVV